MQQRFSNCGYITEKKKEERLHLNINRAASPRSRLDYGFAFLLRGAFFQRLLRTRDGGGGGGLIVLPTSRDIYPDARHQWVTHGLRIRIAAVFFHSIYHGESGKVLVILGGARSVVAVCDALILGVSLGSIILLSRVVVELWVLVVVVVKFLSFFDD